MFSEEVTLAKVLEQRAVSLALQHVVKEHGHPDDPLCQAISHLSMNPHPSEVAAVIHTLREVLLHYPSSLSRDLALAIFVGADLSESLQKAVQSLPQPTTTLDLFGPTREATGRSVFSFWEYLRHPRVLWGALTGSSYGATLIGRWCPFDPKAFGWNASGRIFSERFVDRQSKELGLDWTVGPTPTVGRHVAPETVAAIEGMEDRSSRCYPHTSWIYINLQSLVHTSEGPRSRSLIELSRKHSKTFRVASITVDAPFYRGEEKRLTTLDAHRERLVAELCKDRWYSFVVSEEEKKDWWNCVDSVVEHAYQLAKTTDNQVTVFHELIVLGLVRAWQSFCCRTSAGLAMSTIACRECIDRGGSVNAAFAWAFAEREEDRAKQVMAILWGRALLSRHRLILSSRTRGFEALARACSPVSVREFLNGIWTVGSLGRWQRIQSL